MDYDFNEDYLRNEIINYEKNRHSELFDVLLDYDDPLPSWFNTIFNEYRNTYGVPTEIINQVQNKHGENFLTHIRYEGFVLKDETWHDCDDRLMENWIKKTHNPLFILKTVDPNDFVDHVYSNLIADELIGLGVFVPPIFLPYSKTDALVDSLNNNHEVLRDEYRLYSSRGSARLGNERNLFIMESMKEFISSYPEYSDLIKNQKEFERQLTILKGGSAL